MVKKTTVRELLKDERVFETAKNAADCSIQKICEGAIRDNRVDSLMAVYVSNLFPYYRIKAKTPKNIEEIKDQALGKFWYEASLVGGYMPGELEMHLLKLDDSTPSGLIAELSAQTAEKQRHNPSLKCVLIKMKDDDYNYNSLKEIIDESREKLAKFFNLRQK